MDNQISTLTNSKCEKSFFLQLPRRSRSLWQSLAQKSSQYIASVAPAALSRGLRAVRMARKVNSRLYLALVLMLVAAPLVSICYQLFDQYATIVLYEGQHFFDRNGVRWDFWFYKNYFYLFLSLAPWLTASVFVVGVFFLFPEGSTRAYFLAIPLAYLLAKIGWLITVESDAAFWAIVPKFFFLVAAQIAFLLLFTFDYLMARKFHVFDQICGHIAQIINARRRKLITEERADELLEQENIRLRTFNQQY